MEDTFNIRKMVMAESYWSFYSFNLDPLKSLVGDYICK